MKTLLFPLDGSELAECGMMFALRLFDSEPEKPRLLLLTCLDLNLMFANAHELDAHTMVEFQERDRRLSGRYLKGLSPRLEALGYDVRTLLVEGSPTLEIIRAAKEQEVDQIVLTSHGHGGLVRLLLGSVTEGVIRRADRPVVVIPAAACPDH